jgi:hypothetical protein
MVKFLLGAAVGFVAFEVHAALAWKKVMADYDRL